MEQSMVALKIALRVLTAIDDRTAPDPADIDQLRRLAPLYRGASLEELACEVARRALVVRGHARTERFLREKIA